MLRKIGLFLLICFCVASAKAQVIETYEHDSEYEPELESANVLDLKEDILKPKPRKDG